MKAQLGFVGLGLMGLPMATRLLNKGHALAVYNRTPEKASALRQLGAIIAESPKEAAASSEITFSMVSDSHALLDISIGDNGVLSGLKEGAIHVDMSTVSPETTRELSNRYRTSGRFFLHSPVLGSVPQATDGSLLLFVGGDATAIARAEPFLKTLGASMWKFGRAEQASHIKLLCNMFIAGMGTTLAQALVFAQKANVDPHVLLDIVAHSSLNAPMYQTKGKSILDRNFAPRFFVEHMLKDTALMMNAGRALGVPLPGVEVAQQLFREAALSGYGKEDYSAIVKVLEKKAGTEVGKK